MNCTFLKFVKNDDDEKGMVRKEMEGKELYDGDGDTK